MNEYLFKNDITLFKGKCQVFCNICTRKFSCVDVQLHHLQLHHLSYTTMKLTENGV